MIIFYWLHILFSQQLHLLNINIVIIITASRTAAVISVGSASKNIAANKAPTIRPKVNASRKARKAITLLEHQQNTFF